MSKDKLGHSAEFSAFHTPEQLSDEQPFYPIGYYARALATAGLDELEPYAMETLISERHLPVESERFANIRTLKSLDFSLINDRSMAERLRQDIATLYDEYMMYIKQFDALVQPALVARPGLYGVQRSDGSFQPIARATLHLDDTFGAYYDLQSDNETSLGHGVVVIDPKRLTDPAHLAAIAAFEQ